MSKIPIEKSGLILSGQYKGWYIRVEPESNGYLILYMSKNDPKSHGYDHWVLKDELDKYFDEAKLDIRWPE